MRGNAHVRFWRAGAGNGAGVVTRPPRPFPIRRLIQSTGKGANLSFQFVPRRYQRDSIIISSTNASAPGAVYSFGTRGEQVRNFLERSGLRPALDLVWIMIEESTSGSLASIHQKPADLFPRGSLSCPAAMT